MANTLKSGLLLLAIPALFLTKGIARTESAWICALLAIAVLIVYAFTRTRTMTYCLAARLYLATFACITLWFVLNVVRVLTYDNAAEGHTDLGARTYWLVVENLQPVFQWVATALAIACLIAFVSTLIKKFRSSQPHNV